MGTRAASKGWSLRRKGLLALVIPMVAFSLAAIAQLTINAMAMDGEETGHLRLAAFAVLIAGIVIGGTALVRYVDDITRRLDRLRTDALGLARGDPLSDPLPGGDEIAELSRALVRASDLLSERDLGLRDATWAAERANQSKTVFLSRMSHELRTPLNAMLGFAQLLESDDLTVTQREDVEQILRGGRHLLELINDVLDVSRIEAGELSLAVDAVGLSGVVAEVVGLLGPSAAARGIRIDDRTGQAPAVVRADRQRLLQIVLNLLSNAIKYNRDGGSVTLTTTIEPVVSGRTGESVDIVCFSVADTGPGIAADKRALLFTPFERLGAERTSVDGIGIGLTLSRQLAHAMRGELAVVSAPGEGATFELTLPLARIATDESIDLDGALEVTDGPSPAPAPAPAPSPSPPPPPTMTAIDGTAVGVDGEVLVLCIDDNPVNARVIELAVARLPGRRVLTALRGGAGLELARSQRPALVLLDLHLPDVHGLEVLAALKHDIDTAAVPVVIVSADATHAAARRAAELGAAGYLTKPIDVAMLIDWVARLTASTPRTTI